MRLKVIGPKLLGVSVFGFFFKSLFIHTLKTYPLDGENKCGTVVCARNRGTVWTRRPRPDLCAVFDVAKSYMSLLEREIIQYLKD